MNVRLLAQKIVRSLRDDGLQASVRKAPQYLRRSASDVDDFDRRHGTDTGGFEHIWKFQIDSENARFGTHYNATSEHELVEALNGLSETFSGFSFVDLGCGKGKALMVAARLGFRTVIGVEFAPELAAIARANLARLQISNGVVIDADAATFAFPNDPIVLYLYNPFTREVMTDVVTNLGKSRAEKVYVVYKNPTYADVVLDSSGFLRRRGGLLKDSNIQIWERAPCA